MGMEEAKTGQEPIERIIAVLERAVALYKENSKKGEVYIVAKDMRQGQNQEWTTRTKIAEVVEGYAVSPEGKKIPVWSTDDVKIEVKIVDEE